MTADRRDPLEQELDELSRVLDGERGLEPSAELDERILSEARAALQQPTGRPVAEAWRTPFAAAASVLLCSVLYLTLSVDDEMMEPLPEAADPAYSDARVEREIVSINEHSAEKRVAADRPAPSQPGRTAAPSPVIQVGARPEPEAMAAAPPPPSAPAEAKPDTTAERPFLHRVGSSSASSADATGPEPGLPATTDNASIAAAALENRQQRSAAPGPETAVFLGALEQLLGAPPASVGAGGSAAAVASAPASPDEMARAAQPVPLPCARPAGIAREPDTTLWLLWPHPAVHGSHGVCMEAVDVGQRTVLARRWQSLVDAGMVRQLLVEHGLQGRYVPAVSGHAPPAN